MNDPGNRWRALLFYSILVLGATDRAWIHHLSAHQATEDLAVVWHAAMDYANGEFHEPFFYGQDYGVMLEALLAAPGVALGCSPMAVLPIVIALLALAPYWSFAIWHYRQKDAVAACVFASMPLLLPPEHGIQYTNLNGIALLALYPWAIGRGGSTLGTFLAGAILMAAAAVNLNALVACAALGTHFMVSQSRSPWNVVRALAGAVPVLFLLFEAMRFYSASPDRLAHTVFDWRMDFHPELIPEAMGRLDAHFAWLCPIWWPHGQAAIWLLIALVPVLAAKQNWAGALGIGAALICMLIALCFPKAHDGTSSVLFPLSRIFLAVPLLIAWGVVQLPWSSFRQRWILRAFMPILAITCGLRASRARGIIADAEGFHEGTPLRVHHTELARKECRTIALVAEALDVDLIVILRDPDPGLGLFLNMACPVCEPTMPPTYMPQGERRTWRKAQEAFSIRHRALLVQGSAERWRAAESLSTVSLVSVWPPALHLLIGIDAPIDTVLRKTRIVD